MPGKVAIIPGCGSRAAYCSGVLRRYSEINATNYEAMYGCSSGSISAFVYSYLGIQGLCDFWSNVKGVESLWTRNPWYKIPFKTGIYNQEKLSRFFKSLIKQPRRYRAVVSAVDYKTGELLYLDSDKHSPQLMIRGTIASSSPACLAETDGWGDGAGAILCPVKKAVQDGADQILIVLDRPPDAFPWPAGADGVGGIKIFGNPLLPGLEYANRFLDLILYHSLLKEVRETMEKNELPCFRNVKIKVLGAKTIVAKTFEFNKCAELVELGYNDFTDWTDFFKSR